MSRKYSERNYETEDYQLLYDSLEDLIFNLMLNTIVSVGR